MKAENYMIGQSEVERFSLFSESDRFWIKKLLAILKNKGYSSKSGADPWEEANSLFALEVILRVTLEAPKAQTVYPYANVDIEPIIALALYCISCGHCIEFKPFCFLAERICGGKCRPMIPAAYSAACLHPSLSNWVVPSLSEADLDDCRNTEEPSFFP